MTGRDNVNKQIQTRRKIFSIASIILALGCISLYYLSTKKDNIQSTIIILGLLMTGCFGLYLMSRIFFIKCPFCYKTIPWFPEKAGLDKLSEDYCYCPCCGKELNIEI